MKNFFLITLGLLVVLLGCKKSGDLGEDIIHLQDSKINVSFTDTIDIVAYSVVVDSVSTSKLLQNMLGSHFDPVFGTTTASIYTQLRLSQNNVDFGQNAVCDSIILTLDYVGFYGDSNTVQTLRVYEVADDLYFDSTYYSNDTVAVNPIEIGSLTAAFNLTDSINYDGVKVEPHLILPLNKSFGEKIMAKSGMTELSDNENFSKFIKGIFITADKTVNDGGLAYVDLMSAISIVSLYYHNDEDTLVYKFAINEFCSYFNTFNHYSYIDASAEFRNQVIYGDTSLGNQKLYIQSTGGVKTHFYIPYLEQFDKDGPVAIQKAEFLINVVSGTDNYHAPVYGLAVVKIDSTGKQQFIDDYYEGSSYFGGDYNSTSKNYTFNLNRYIQSVVNGTQKQYGLEILPKGASIYGNRVIFAGPKSADRRLRLKLTYTKVN